MRNLVPATLGLAACLASSAFAQDRPEGPPEGTAEERPTGVLSRADELAPGYALFAPLNAGSTWLVDADGNAVHSWERDTPPGQSVTLLPNGNLLRAERPLDADSPMRGGGEGGRLVELDWDGNVVWTYELCDDEHRLHHDFEPLPNGNVLVVLWEAKTNREARLEGRHKDGVGEDGLWPDAIWELKPTRPEGAEVVWAWHAFDHLVQDQREDLANFGVVADSPRRINVNIGTAAAAKPETDEERAEREANEERLRGLGYGGPAPGSGRTSADWMHTNAIDYDPELDLIAISLRSFSEIWVIDHSTTTEDARGSTGGRQGVGGDLVWRYGNPQNYHRGGSNDQVSFGQHDVRWLRHEGRPALSIFNNGDRRPDGKFSCVDVIALPVDDAGRFAAPVNGSFAPASPTWTWKAEEPEAMFSSHISGAFPLPHGGFLVCDGDSGRLIDVSPEGKVRWDFVSPVEGSLGRGGRGGPRGRRGPGGDRPPRGDRGPGGDAPGGRGRRGGGPGSPNALFRADWIAADHPALEGRDLTPEPLPMGPARGPGAPDGPQAGPPRDESR